jgi:Spy/CpxP family protein refolding chaperone
MRIAALLFAAAGMTALATFTDLAAQEKDPPKRPGFPPGGGFPGGGFGFGGGGPVGLLNSKLVKSEIKITEEQEVKLKDVTASIGEKAKEAFAKYKDLPREEVRAKMAEVGAEVSKIAYKELGGVLKPEQVDRLKQIGVQVGGVSAYRTPEVEAALKLTDDQKAKIKETLDEYRKDQRELRDELGLTGFGPPRDKEKAAEFEKKNAALVKEATDAIVGALKDEQKAAWKTLTGEPFDVKKFQEEQRAAFANFGPRPREKDAPKKDADK